MEKFVGVRIVQANGMDLSLFQFDYDLTFAAFFLNADRTIYGRYGSRSDSRQTMREMSMEGFRKSLQAALEIHEGYPANRDSLRGKRGPASRVASPEKYPSLKKYASTLDLTGQVARSCVHCHMVSAAERKVLRSSGKPFGDEVLYPWPMPDAVGLELDPRERATVRSVTPGSAAAKGGFRRGDEVLRLEGQPLVSIADVQWILHRAGDSAKLAARVRRDGREVELTLSLDDGWRRGGDISWRTTTWDLRRMATGGLVLEDLPAGDRRQRDLGEERLALRVEHVGQYGEHATAKRAGFRKGDIVVEFAGRTRRMTESDLIVYVLEQKKPGARIPVTVLRGKKRVDLELPVR